jgi:hypothetical protein
MIFPPTFTHGKSVPHVAESVEVPQTPLQELCEIFGYDPDLKDHKLLKATLVLEKLKNQAIRSERNRCLEYAIHCSDKFKTFPNNTPQNTAMAAEVVADGILKGYRAP